jgi:16S rRNA (cytosine1402-N4)-methyltransferase
MAYHIPVMLKECLEGLNIDPTGTYVDVTFGGGGHSIPILNQLSEDGRLIAFDQDKDALRNAPQHPSFLLVNSNYRHLRNFIKYHEALPVDGILADLGVSSHQIDEATRGFSTRFEGPLDLRMDQRKSISAADLVNTYDFDQLKYIFTYYGEIKNTNKLCNAIIDYRKHTEIKNISHLKEAIEKCVDQYRQNKYLAKVFQALRIEVNDEMGALKDLLEHSLSVLKPGGRLVVMSYHSLEDRLVKNFFKSGNFEGKIEKDFYGNPIVPWKKISGKPIVATPEEIERNPRSRSAKLRIAEKKEEDNG